MSLIFDHKVHPVNEVFIICLYKERTRAIKVGEISCIEKKEH
jgi:hypothetical protein